MKKILKTLLLLSALPTALMAQPMNYVVEGKLGNLSAPAKAYFDYTKNGALVTDSVVINHGRFTFRGVSKQPDEIVFLVISKSGKHPSPGGDSKFIMFYADAKKISVISAGDDVTKAKITGGILNRDQTALNAVANPIEDKIKALDKAYESTSKKSKAFTESYEKESNALEQEKKAIYLNFIKTHPNSPISLNALKNFGGNIQDVTEFEPAFNLLSPGIRSSKNGLVYAQKIAELKTSAVGVMAPDFAMPDTAGTSVSLHSFKGKYILLDFWASWCPPCRAENPTVVEAYHTYKDNNFTVISVSLDGPGAKEKWLKAIHDDHLTWTQVSDLKYDNQAAKLYSVQAIPQNFLISPEGKIVARNLRGEALKLKLKELLTK